MRNLLGFGKPNENGRFGDLILRVLRRCMGKRNPYQKNGILKNTRIKGVNKKNNES